MAKIYDYIYIDWNWLQHSRYDTHRKESSPPKNGFNAARNWGSAQPPADSSAPQSYSQHHNHISEPNSTFATLRDQRVVNGVRHCRYVIGSRSYYISLPSHKICATAARF